MTKQDIIEHLTHNCGMQRSSAITATEGVIQAITGALESGQDVNLRGFATFKVKEVAAKFGRNIANNTPVTIPAHKTVKLILSKEFKNSLNS